MVVRGTTGSGVRSEIMNMNICEGLSEIPLKLIQKIFVYKICFDFSNAIMDTRKY